MEVTTKKLIFVNDVAHWYLPDGRFERAKTDNYGRVIENTVYLKKQRHFKPALKIV